MVIEICQQNYHIGDFEYNTGKIIQAIQAAKQRGVDLLVFSELSVCGYPARDFLEFSDFIASCEVAVKKIAQAAQGIGVLVGAPVVNPIREGKDLFNAAFLVENGEILAELHKTLLPTYDIFDENRYFEPAYSWKVVNFRGKKLAVTICEDIWNLGDNPLYRICPMDELMKQGPEIMINLSASPFDYDHDEARKSIIQANVRKYKLPMVYCNAVGAQTEVVFDGGSVAYNQRGELIAELAYFQEDFAVLKWSDDLMLLQGASPVPGGYPFPAVAPRVEVTQGWSSGAGVLSYLLEERNIAQIYAAIVMGIRDYFSKMGFTKAILGSSGGIDSAVALALACDALGPDQVRAVLMPSQFSSDHSVKDAEQLSKNLGNPYDIVPIKPVYDQFLNILNPLFGELPFSLAEENLQSRTRGNLLMAIANKFGYILLNTSNKSELATGYGTLYGDMAGGLSVLGDVYKVQVFALAHYLNKLHGREIIPANILTKAPSAELRPDQKDSDSLPPYEQLDELLFQYIERRQGPGELIKAGYDPDFVKRVLKMVNTNEYKRNQFCPIIRVSTKAFGVGRRMPIVGKYLGY